jgi:hypothetical protein
MIDKNKMIEEILQEYSYFEGVNEVNTELLDEILNNKGYADFFSDVKESSEKTLSDEDINILKTLIGSRLKVSDEELKKLDLSLVGIPPYFPGRVTLDKLERAIALENRRKRKVKLTLADSRVRIIINGKTVVQLDTSVPNVFSKNFPPFLLLLEFYKKHKNDLDVSQKEAAGLKAEFTQVDHINDYFKKNNPDGNSFHLFLKDGTTEVDSQVNVDSATKESGVFTKSDITLLDKTKPVFWISFKDSDFFKKEGSPELARINFQQWGSIKSLNQVYSNNPTWAGIITKMVSGIQKHIQKTELTSVDVGILAGKKVVSKINGIPVKEMFQGKDVELVRMHTLPILKFFNDSTLSKKYLYLCPEGFYTKLDFLDGTDETKEIAGKAIYGLEFKLDGSAPFSKENVNILMQSSTPVVLEPYTKIENISSILMSTNAKGHILFNPNLPLPKDTEDPILKYRPVIHSRPTDTENDKEVINGEGHLFLRMRVFIYPAERIPKGSIDLGV